MLSVNGPWNIHISTLDSVQQSVPFEMTIWMENRWNDLVIIYYLEKFFNLLKGKLFLTLTCSDCLTLDSFSYLCLGNILLIPWFDWFNLFDAYLKAVHWGPAYNEYLIFWK